MQQSIFSRKNGFKSSIFYIKLTFKWLQTGLSDLKNTKQLKFCSWVIFYAFFLNIAYFIFFSVFWNSPVAPGKIV